MKAFFTMIIAILLSFATVAPTVSTDETQYSENVTSVTIQSTPSQESYVVANTTVTEPAITSAAVKLSTNTTTQAVTKELKNEAYATAVISDCNKIVNSEAASIAETPETTTTDSTENDIVKTISANTSIDVSETTISTVATAAQESTTTTVSSENEDTSVVVITANTNNNDVSNIVSETGYVCEPPEFTVTTTEPENELSEFMDFDWYHPHFEVNKNYIVYAWDDTNSNNEWGINANCVEGGFVTASIYSNGATTLKFESEVYGIAYLCTVWTENGEIVRESDMIQISLDGFKPNSTYTIYQETDGTFEELELTSNSDGIINCVIWAGDTYAEFNYVVEEYKYSASYYISEGLITNCLSSIQMLDLHYYWEDETFVANNYYNILVFSPETMTNHLYPDEYNCVCEENGILHIPVEYGTGDYVAYVVELGEFKEIRLDCYGNITIK